jgi:hypothetical protein
MGGTRSKVEGGDRHDLEPEGTREDTRHEIYTRTQPYVLFRVVLRPALGVVPGGIEDVWLGTRPSFI